MTDISVNAATGEVSVTLGGKQFHLRATMQRVADLEAQLGVDGLPGVQAKLSQHSAGLALIALRCLCTSGNDEDLDDVRYSDFAVATGAIWKALAAGLPEPKRGKAVATTRGNGQHRGRDTEPLPSAS